jgi:hypothetical protein
MPTKRRLDFSLCHHIWNCSGTHLALYPLYIGESFCGQSVMHLGLWYRICGSLFPCAYMYLVSNDSFSFSLKYSVCNSLLIFFKSFVTLFYQCTSLSSRYIPLFLLLSFVIVANGAYCFTLELQLLMGPLSISHLIHAWICCSHVVLLLGKNEELREKPIPVPLCLPQILHGLP